MGREFGCGDGSGIDWQQRHVVRVFFCSLPSGCLVYQSFVAAVAAMVSVLSLIHI